MVMSQGPCSNPFGFQIGLRTMWSSFKSHLNGQNSPDFLFVCCVLLQLLCWLLSPPSTPFLFHEPAWILRIQPFMAAVLPTWHKGCVGFLGVYTFASVSADSFLSIVFFLSICTVAVSLASFEIMFAPPSPMRQPITFPRPFTHLYLLNIYIVAEWRIHFTDFTYHLHEEYRLFWLVLCIRIHWWFASKISSAFLWIFVLSIIS